MSDQKELTIESNGNVGIGSRTSRVSSIDDCDRVEIIDLVRIRRSFSKSDVVKIDDCAITVKNHMRRTVDYSTELEEFRSLISSWRLRGLVDLCDQLEHAYGGDSIYDMFSEHTYYEDGVVSYAFVAIVYLKDQIVCPSTRLYVTNTS